MTLRSSWWLIGAALLLLVPAWKWAMLPPQLLAFPETPVSHINAEYAAQWKFLKEARHAVLPGNGYTIRASDADVEMALFMMSIGLCTDRRPHPSSYFRVQFPAEGAKARYVLAYRDFTGGEARLRKVVSVVNGTVYERVGPR